jgi:hypothetical protein
MPITAMRMTRTLVPLLLLAGCAGSPRMFGDPQAAPALREGGGFTLATQGPASTAVSAELVRAGFTESAAGDYRVEVGFAIRARDLSLTTLQGETPATTISPGTRPALRLCKRQAYVLTVAFVERTSGKVIARRGATTGRCSGPVEQVLPKLARTVVSPMGGPHAEAGKRSTKRVPVG